MEINVVTSDDLNLLRKQLGEDFKKILNEKNSATHKRWVRTTDVEDMLGISSSSVQNLRASGILQYSKISGTIFYKLEDIEQLLENNHSGNQML